MRARLALFADDVHRFGPLAVVTFATACCVPSLLELAGYRLAIASMLERFLGALVFATIGVRVLQRALVRYALRNVTDDEEGELALEARARADHA